MKQDMVLTLCINTPSGLWTRVRIFRFNPALIKKQQGLPAAATWRQARLLFTESKWNDLSNPPLAAFSPSSLIRPYYASNSLLETNMFNELSQKVFI